jgi:hypothetical protein
MTLALKSPMILQPLLKPSQTFLSRVIVSFFPEKQKSFDPVRR